MIEFLLPAVLGATFLYLFTQNKTETPALPPKKDDAVPEKKECPYGEDKPVEKLPEDIKNAVIGALTVENDPAELEAMAKTMDSLCQPTSAKAIRAKKAAIEAALAKGGLPTDKSPDLTTFPIPGVIGSTPVPDVPSVTTPDGYVFDNKPQPTDSFELLSAEPLGALPDGVAQADCRSLPTTQWWSGPYNKTGVGSGYGGPFYLAEAITGNGLRYVELIMANPEKKTVGDPTNPMLTGYSFVSLAEGERVRIPRTWNQYIDQIGDYSGGTVYDACNAIVSPFTAG